MKGQHEAWCPAALIHAKTPQMTSLHRASKGHLPLSYYCLPTLLFPRHPGRLPFLETLTRPSAEDLRIAS